MRATTLVGLLGFAGLALPSALAQAVATPLDTVRVALGVPGALFLTSPPGDLQRQFIVLQGGSIRILKNGALLTTPFLTIPATTVLSGGERGLLGLAFHPNYASNGFFYVNYTRQPDGATVIARYQVSANPDVASTVGTILLTIPQPYSNHNGGGIAFGPYDGYLYIGMGDGGSGYDPLGSGQNINSLLGKMLRIDVDNPAPPLAYGIPPTNPFAGAIPGLDPIWSLGLRNPWRWSFDRLTGDMYLGDVGQDQREEVDFEPAGVGGRNYGWRCMEGTLCTGLSGCTCNSAPLTLPIYTYVTGTGCAVTGGYVYRGCAIPDLRGTYFFADYCNNQIWSFRYTPAAGLTQFLNRTVELAPGGGIFINSIAGFGEDALGEVYICDLGGEVFKIVPQGRVQVGLSPYGTGVPGCSGPHTLNGICNPTLLNPGFGLSCNHAPADSIGIVVLGTVQDATGSDPLGIGVNLFMNVLAGLFFPIPAASNASGIGTLPLPIPNSSALVGATLYGQAFWFWPGGPCTPSPLGLSTSNGLAITIQP